MKKSEIQTRNGNPCVNVKSYNFAHGLDIAAEFGCDEKTASKAMEYAWESACSLFWVSIDEIATHNLGAHVKVYAEGRSSGWLVVHNLPPVESWDAIQLSKWARFEKEVRQQIDWLSSTEQVKDAIEANEWAKPGAELYNFIDGKDGKPVCLADLKAKAIEAGFGAVVCR